MFFPLFLAVFGWTVTAGLRDGTSRAVAVGWLPAAWLLPVWMTAGVGSLVLDLRTAAGFAVVLVALAKGPRLRPTLPDFLILAVILTQVVSQYHAGSLRPLTIPEVARKWFLPYFAGRMLIGSVADIRTVTPLFARVIIGLTLLALVECFSKINPINTLLGKTYGLLEQGEGYRWGLKRAHVTFDHPIFFGMGLVLLLPWALEAARQTRLGQGPRWWRWLPMVIAAALFATVSRGPQLAGIGTAVGYLFFRVPMLRIPLALMIIGGGTASYVLKEQLVDLLAVVAGEKGGDQEERILIIDGEEVVYTGTNHRILLFRVYADPIAKVGFFGYGTELKGVEIEESLSQRFGSIDCHYLLFLLQHGYFAIGAFLILTLGTVLRLTWIALRRDQPQAALAAGLAGALTGVAVLLMSVWFSPDFAGIWLFSAGLAGSLPSKFIVPTTSETPTIATVSRDLPLNPVIRRVGPPIRPLACH